MLHVEAILISIATMAMMQYVWMCTSDLHINNATKVIVIELLCKDFGKKEKKLDNRHKTIDISVMS